jgi:hypothetical protein
MPELDFKKKDAVRGNGKSFVYIYRTNIIKTVAFKPTIRTFSNMLAGQIEGIRHPPNMLT